MYQTLLSLHSLVRWFVLILVICALCRSLYGYIRKSRFSAADNSIRHWSATMAHVQLMIGILLYTQSSVTKAFWSNPRSASVFDLNFFGLIHALLMLTAIVMLTIGSALAKRRATDREKFRTIIFWYLLSLIIILIAIPWPFSPLSNRPYFRNF